MKDILFTKPDENINRFIRLVKKRMDKSKQELLIIDIGAFDGRTSIQFSKAFPACKVLAFEPNNVAFELAKKNLFSYPHVTLSDIAISDKSGKAEFNVTVNNVSSSLNKINTEAIDLHQKEEIAVTKRLTVSTQPLDELTIDKEILALKIDVQGHEKEVISGGKKTLKNVHFILIEMNNHEIYAGSSKYYEVDELLRENDFRLADIIVTFRKDGILVTEYDAIYLNRLKYPDLGK